MRYSVPWMLIPFLTGLAWIILFKISLPITKGYGEIWSPCLQPLWSGKDFDRYRDIYCSSSFWLHNIALHRKSRSLWQEGMFSAYSWLVVRSGNIDFRGVCSLTLPNIGSDWTGRMWPANQITAWQQSKKHFLTLLDSKICFIMQIQFPMIQRIRSVINLTVEKTQWNRNTFERSYSRHIVIEIEKPVFENLSSFCCTAQFS